MAHSSDRHNRRYGVLRRGSRMERNEGSHRYVQTRGPVLSPPRSIALQRCVPGSLAESLFCLRCGLVLLPLESRRIEILLLRSFPLSAESIPSTESMVGGTTTVLLQPENRIFSSNPSCFCPLRNKTGGLLMWLDLPAAPRA
jgi:hypothetical protein